MEHAEHSRAPVQKTADRLAGYLVYDYPQHPVHHLSDHRRACGIATGTPLAILGAIGQVDTVILDKTGTLTCGNPEAAEVCPVPGVREEEVVEAAAIAERPPEHAPARAIRKKASGLALPVAEPEHFEYAPGKGIFSSASRFGVIAAGSWSLLREKGVPPDQFDRLQNPGTVLVARNGRLLGAIRIEDQLRPEAVAAVQMFQSTPG